MESTKVRKKRTEEQKKNDKVRYRIRKNIPEIKSKLKSQRKKYYQLNKEKIKKRSQEYNKNNKNKIKEYNRFYTEKNKLSLKEKADKRYNKKRQLECKIEQSDDIDKSSREDAEQSTIQDIFSETNQISNATSLLETVYVNQFMF